MLASALSRPVDACEEGTHTCDIPERARCTYTGGSSYDCSCLPGFGGDGRTCQGSGETRPKHNKTITVASLWWGGGGWGGGGGEWEGNDSEVGGTGEGWGGGGPTPTDRLV